MSVTKDVALHADVSTAVHLLLRRAKKTQRELSEHLGVSQVTISSRMTGKTPWRLEEVIAISEWLRVPLNVILDGPDPK
jgi:transcriptional regulator with XRE-family HTH domain